MCISNKNKKIKDTGEGGSGEKEELIHKSRLPPTTGNGEIDEYDAKDEYIKVNSIQPHWIRRKLISKKYPQVLNFPTNHSPTAFWVLALVAMFIISAKLLENSSWWLIFVVSYVFGATVSHGLGVLVHELTHDLVFKSSFMNCLFILIADLPHLVPMGITFRHFHRLHHSFFGETYSDPDIPLPVENSIFGKSIVGKAIWYNLYFLVISLRSAFYPVKNQSPFSIWLVANYAFNLSFTYFLYQYVGFKGMAYLILSNLMAVGLFLHPLGARWIAEHFAVTQSEQETYSTYGLINKLAFNVGYHTEHHDFVRVPYIYLPTIANTANEFYRGGQKYHTSYWRVLYEFLTLDTFTFNSRVVRDVHSSRAN